jgi:ligand-binding sensor domain-containing protein
VITLEQGGLALLRGGTWHELRSGFGTLHARCLLQAPGGELLVGAREGLFRARSRSPELDRLTTHPVRALAIAPGTILAGGESGLFRVVQGRSTPIAIPEPWIESVAVVADRVYAATAAGLVSGPLDGPLEAVRGGEAVAQAVLHEGRLWTVTQPPQPALRVMEAGGHLRDEWIGSPVRRVFSEAGVLLADTEQGLQRRDPDGWRPVQPRKGTLPAGPAHVTALARFRGRLFAGLFDGGIVVAEETAEGLAWKPLSGTAAWGTNALLVAGGELWIASLRGVARYDGATLMEVAGPGAAFSLATTRNGVALGYGQGVFLPGSTLLSAFHGLPGNQALALLEHEGQLLVATPSGLGAIAGRRVLWRVTGGEGKLPHPWVTSLLANQDGLLVGTWGGGLAHRRVGSGPARGALQDAGSWTTHAETEGLAVSPGALVSIAGRAWAGTDAHGLWRQSADGARFERVRAALPSARVGALLAEPGVLWVGTDQGVVRLPLEVAE